jgi:hypothetical protein
LQLGLLVGLAVAGGAVRSASAACPIESKDGALKPILLFVVDYSAVMNEPYSGLQTRWEAARQVVTSLASEERLRENYMIGLLRYAHDSAPGIPGTTIPGDPTGVVDGVALDVSPYDLQAPGHPYSECTNGDAVIAALQKIPTPFGGDDRGPGPWTRGGLEAARALLEQADADHPTEVGRRRAAVVVVTGGAWHDATGTTSLMPPAADPADTAAGLFAELGAPTFVVAVGDEIPAQAGDDLAGAGGTGRAFEFGCEDDPSQSYFIRTWIEELVRARACGASSPRIMVLIDASSEMLNVGGTFGLQGETPWDHVRSVLSGPGGLLNQDLGPPPLDLEPNLHAGLAVAGDAEPVEQKIVLDYGLCHAESMNWALDPATSCDLPGCADPWGGPPISWTFKQSGVDSSPYFPDVAVSHVPRCDQDLQVPLACTGSESFLHAGLKQIQANLAKYKSACGDPKSRYPCAPDAKFLNILISDGVYDSADAEVQAPLAQMFAAGVITHVIGFGGDVDEGHLNKMAAWGSGDALAPHLAADDFQLWTALLEIVEPAIDLSPEPCCAGLECGETPDPRGLEPDPVPGLCDFGSSSDTGAPDTTGPSTTGPTTGDPATTGPDDGESTGGAPSTGTTGAEPTSGGPAPSGSSGSDGAAGSFEPGAGGGAGCTCAAMSSEDNASGLLAALVGLVCMRIRRRP